MNDEQAFGVVWRSGVVDDGTHDDLLLSSWCWRDVEEGARATAGFLVVVALNGGWAKHSFFWDGTR